MFNSRLMAAAFLLLSTVPLSASAAPALSARWGRSISCVAGPLDEAVPGFIPFNEVILWVERPEDAVHYGYEIEVVVGDPTGPLPDAWRFEDGGCQPAGRLTLEGVYLVDPANFCPYLGGALNALTTRSITFDPVTSRLRARLRYEFPAGYVVDPTRAYRTGRVAFDHTSSVAGASTSGLCGGVERAVCLGISGSWIDAQGALHSWPVATPFLTANGGGGLACDAVPTAPTTWGMIKAQYR